MKFDIYDDEESSQARFKLGISGLQPLFVFGVNPSTANKNKSDSTITRVRNFSRSAGFLGFVMLNLYPQRTTIADKLHQKLDEKFTKQNKKIICSIIQMQNQPEIWAAWGDLILSRNYLWNCLEEIANEFRNSNLIWKYCGKPTKLGHPRHPSRLSYKEKFFKFDILEYLNKKRIVEK